MVGEVKARADAPNTNEATNAASKNAIPWLLLTAKSSSGASIKNAKAAGGGDGVNGADGVFGNVKSVQRINTIVGVAPAQCSPSELGMTLNVPYTATYIFSR